MSVPKSIAVWCRLVTRPEAPPAARTQRGESATVDPDCLPDPELPLPAPRRPPHLLGVRDGNAHPRLVRHGQHRLGAPPHRLRFPAVSRLAGRAHVRRARRPAGWPPHALRHARELRRVRGLHHAPRHHGDPDAGVGVRGGGAVRHRAHQRSRDAPLAHRRDHPAPPDRGRARHVPRRRGLGPRGGRPRRRRAVHGARRRSRLCGGDRALSGQPRLDPSECRGDEGSPIPRPRTSPPRPARPRRRAGAT